MPSPIESQLIAAICANLPADTLLWDYTPYAARALYDDDHGWYVSCDEGERVGVKCCGNESIDTPLLIRMYSQVQIYEYRADLVIYCGGAHTIVECDGHDWHERTKQQAAYDRERDRHFLARGIVTARFTGSEIVHYPEKCCADLFAIVFTQRRISNALSRNGFHIDGRSFYYVPSTAMARGTDGTEFEGFWNPGRDES